MQGLSIEEALSPASYLRSKTLTLDGRTQSHPEWLKELAINQRTLWGRILKGWSDKDILLTPVVDTRFQARP